MSKMATEFQEKQWLDVPEQRSPNTLNTSWIGVACVREWVADIFNFSQSNVKPLWSMPRDIFHDRLAEKNVQRVNPVDTPYPYHPHQDTDHVNFGGKQTVRLLQCLECKMIQEALL